MSEEDVTTAVGAFVAVLAFLSVALRFYARHYIKVGFKWDDWFILLALIATILTDVLVLFSTSVNPNGAKAASDEIPGHVYTPDDVFYTKLNYAASILYFTIASATKLSLLLLYNRIFSIDKSFRRQVYVASATVIGFWIGTTVSNLLSCRPMEYTWINAKQDPRYCFNYNYYWLATGIVEALIDAVIIVIPVRMVYRLQLSKSKKIAVAGVFLLGIFVIFSGIVKVILSYAPGNRNPSFSRTEVWTTVHTCTGIVCACLPTFWPIFARLAKLKPRNWRAISSLRKRWYSFSGSSSADKESSPGASAPEFGGSQPGPEPPESYPNNDMPGQYVVPEHNAPAYLAPGCDRNTFAVEARYELPMYYGGPGTYAVPVEGGYGYTEVRYVYDNTAYIPQPQPQPKDWTVNMSVMQQEPPR